MKEFPELHRDFVDQRMKFIHVELEAGVTFIQVAETERASGNIERAEHNMALARQASREARRRILEANRSDAPEAFDSAKRKLTVLDARIDAYLSTPE